MPFSQLTLTVVITVPPGCPFLCLAGLVGTDWLSLLASGEKVPQSAGNTRREKRRDEEREEVK